MTELRVVALGAGQDVGRSCVVATIGGKNVMFDCGMHMGYKDTRRFPDFSFLSSKGGTFDGLIDAVVISHFHLDHCGALPYFTEMLGYNGPVYMTYPTKAVVPILLEDYRKIMVERKGEANFFTSAMIRACMRKVIPVAVGETVRVDDELVVRAYYAGHVLGAAMFYAACRGQSVVYTGDYNMTPDRHLGAARIEKLRPDLLITETTYATTIRDSKRVRENDFLKRVHRCVERGGKVLIPVFALGRAQELCILVETYWERMNLGHVPVYFSAGLTEKANLYYKLFVSWSNEKIKSTFVERNLFDFRYIKPFDRQLADAPGPMVLFATPGMLHAGTSLDVFKKWAPSPLNLVVIPGFCVVGTVGNRLLAGREHKAAERQVQVDQRTTVTVRCKIKYLSFSAHADAKGIKQLIRQAAPRHVMLVHGEKEKMEYLQRDIVDEFGINCFFPPNGVSVAVPTSFDLPVTVSLALLAKQLPTRHDADYPNDYRSFDPLHQLDYCPSISFSSNQSSNQSSIQSASSSSLLSSSSSSSTTNQSIQSIQSIQSNQSNQSIQSISSLVESSPVSAVLLLDKDKAGSMQLVSHAEAVDYLGLPEHLLELRSVHPIPAHLHDCEAQLFRRVAELLQARFPADAVVVDASRQVVAVRSVRVSADKQQQAVTAAWPSVDQPVAAKVVAVIAELLAGPAPSRKRDAPDIADPPPSFVKVPRA